MDRQVEVVAGSHVVTRIGGAVIAVAHRERGRLTPDSRAMRAARALAELVAEASEQAPEGPGRLVARQATRWLMKEADRISPGESVDFGILSAADTGGIAIFLHGAVTAVLAGRVVEYYRGSDAAFTVDRVAEHPARAAAVYIDDGKGRVPELPDRGIGSLVDGVAQASGAIVWFVGDPVIAPRPARFAALGGVAESGAGQTNQGSAAAGGVGVPPGATGQGVAAGAEGSQRSARGVPPPTAAFDPVADRPEPSYDPNLTPTRTSARLPTELDFAPESPAGSVLPDSVSAEAAPPHPPSGSRSAGPESRSPQVGSQSVGRESSSSQVGSRSAGPESPLPQVGSRSVGSDSSLPQVDSRSAQPDSQHGRSDAWPGDVHPGSGRSPSGSASAASPSTPAGSRAARADSQPVPPRDDAATGGFDPHHAPTEMGGTNPAPKPDPDLQRRLDSTAKATALTVKVLGFKCARAHPSDPRSAFCTVCGMPVDQTQQLAQVIRPPLGMLVLDDGMTYMLAADAVVGRDPDQSEQARAGLVPLRIDDASGGMSRAHAEIRLVNWDVTVVDRGSTNGTRVRNPGYRDWIRLQPNQPMVLAHGAEVMLGNRVLRLDPVAPPPFG